MPRLSEITRTKEKMPEADRFRQAAPKIVHKAITRNYGHGYRLRQAAPQNDCEPKLELTPEEQLLIKIKQGDVAKEKMLLAYTYKKWFFSQNKVKKIYRNKQRKQIKNLLINLEKSLSNITLESAHKISPEDITSIIMSALPMVGFNHASKTKIYKENVMPYVKSDFLIEAEDSDKHLYIKLFIRQTIQTILDKKVQKMEVAKSRMYVSPIAERRQPSKRLAGDYRSPALANQCCSKPQSKFLKGRVRLLGAFNRA